MTENVCNTEAFFLENEGLPLNEFVYFFLVTAKLADFIV